MENLALSVFIYANLYIYETVDFWRCTLLYQRFYIHIAFSVKVCQSYYEKILTKFEIKTNDILGDRHVNIMLLSFGW